MLYWTSVDGATSYKVYGASDPFGTFTLLQTTANTWWIDPGFPQARRFYYVTAVLPARGERALNGAPLIPAKTPTPPTPADSGIHSPQPKTRE